MDIKNRIVEAAGGATKLADYLGCKVQAVYQWNQVPVKRVLDIAKLTGIPPHEIRPDVYPEPQHKFDSVDHSVSST